MLTIQIEENELYDEHNNEFIYVKPTSIVLEHSLVSISKWEQKYKRPFLDTTKQKTVEETLYYIECMTITQNVNKMVYMALSKQNIDDIKNYINDSKTATTITNNNPNKSRSKEILTSELIYYYMFSSGISIKCEKWHLSRLLTLLQVVSVKNEQQNGKKMPTSAVLKNNAQLNAARRKALHTKG